MMPIRNEIDCRAVTMKVFTNVIKPVNYCDHLWKCKYSISSCFHWSYPEQKFLLATVHYVNITWTRFFSIGVSIRRTHTWLRNRCYYRCTFFTNCYFTIIIGTDVLLNGGLNITVCVRINNGDASRINLYHQQFTGLLWVLYLVYNVYTFRQYYTIIITRL